MTPRLPDPEEEELPPTEGERNAATCLAAAMMLAFFVGLAFLVGMIFPTGFYILLLIAVSAGVFLFHYLVWGRWLSARLRETPEESEGTADDADRADITQI